MTIPIAILCGGRGTRSGLPINKCFVSVNGKPMILRIMEQFEDQGFTTFMLCRGTGGTLTDLRNASKMLGPRFICVYGDTYLKIDLHDFIDKWQASQLPAATAIRDGIDAGVNGFKTWLLDVDDKQTSLVVLQSILQDSDAVHYYDASERWYEVGTPEALAETRAALI